MLGEQKPPEVRRLGSEPLAKCRILAGPLDHCSPGIGWVIAHLHQLTGPEPARFVHPGEDLDLEGGRDGRIDAYLELDDQISVTGKGGADGEDLARRGAAALAELLGQPLSRTGPVYPASGSQIRRIG